MTTKTSLRNSRRKVPSNHSTPAHGGPSLVVRHFFDQLGLWKLLAAGRRWTNLLPEEDPDDDWVSRVAVLITNRLTRPSSEHGLAYWLETDYVCDRDGRRYVPYWKQHQRVQVDLTQLQRWYRTLDHLLVNKDNVEVAVFKRLRTLFDFRAELVFYDLTSTYFEGHGPSLAKHGYSRDGKPRKVQVVVGVVMIAGWPIAHHVWAGNTRDSATVKEVIADLENRFGLVRIVFVGDRGMVTKENLQILKEKEEQGFLVGMTRRRNPEAETLIDRVKESKWIECDIGITAKEKKEPPRTRVQEVKCDHEGVRVFIVDSDERRVHDERQRSKMMNRAREALEQVQTRVAKGQLKKPEKIGAAARISFTQRSTRNTPYLASCGSTRESAHLHRCLVVLDRANAGASSQGRERELICPIRNRGTQDSSPCSISSQ